MKIAFYSHHLSERGTEIALYDFAKYNEEILSNQSIVIFNPETPQNNKTAIDKFEKRFQIERIKLPSITYVGREIISEIDKIIQREKCDILYFQCGGKNDGFISKHCKTVILVCSTNYEPYGDRYAYVSKWLSETMTQGKTPWIPIIIDLHDTEENLRLDLGIPSDAIVFGRTGGMDTWNIHWANNVVKESLNLRKDIFYIFQNTPKFIQHDRVKFINTTVDPVYKSMFINSCDVFLHARAEGESFGQSIAEFSTKNKRIITYKNSPEKNHIQYLGEKGIYYQDPESMLQSIVNFQILQGDWNVFKQHSPQLGIQKFKEIFLD